MPNLGDLFKEKQEKIINKAKYRKNIEENEGEYIKDINKELLIVITNFLNKKQVEIESQFKYQILEVNNITETMHKTIKKMKDEINEFGKHLANTEKDIKNDLLVDAKEIEEKMKKIEEKTLTDIKKKSEEDINKIKCDYNELLDKIKSIHDEIINKYDVSFKSKMNDIEEEIKKYVAKNFVKLFFKSIPKIFRG